LEVLYATDGGELAIDAGEVMAAAGDREEINVTVLSVASDGLPAVKHLSEVLQSKADRRDRAERAAEAAVTRLAQAGFRVDAITAEGTPHEVIASVAERRGAELLLLGAGPRSPIHGHFLGSAATELMHGSTPLLVARRAPVGGRMRVVVGTDGSGDANRATELASRFLDPERCQVTIVSVAVLIAVTPGAPYGGYATSASNEATERTVSAPAWEHVDEAAAIMQVHRFDAHREVVMGHPAKRLVAVADRQDASLLVVGTRGRSYMERAFLGSVSEEIVRHAPACLVGR
jgi:nucleotide-binding universal stress UspA family protein